MAICSAYACSNNTNHKRSGVSFHKFPKDDLLRQQWVKAIGRLNWQPGVHSILCSDHFNVDFLNRTSACGRTELRENAVPTIFACYPANLQPSIKKIRKMTRPHAAVEPNAPNITKHIEHNIDKPMYVSKTSYRYLRESFNSAPHPQTLVRWHSTFDASPGICSEAFNALKEKSTRGMIVHIKEEEEQFISDNGEVVFIKQEDVLGIKEEEELIIPDDDMMVHIKEEEDIPDDIQEKEELIISDGRNDIYFF